MVCNLGPSIATVSISFLDEFRRCSSPLKQYASWGSLRVRLSPRNIANEAIRLVLPHKVVRRRKRGRGEETGSGVFSHDPLGRPRDRIVTPNSKARSSEPGDL